MIRRPPRSTLFPLHDALPISDDLRNWLGGKSETDEGSKSPWSWLRRPRRSEEHTSELQSPCNLVCRLLLEKKKTESTNTDSINDYLLVSPQAASAHVRALSYD